MSELQSDNGLQARDRCLQAACGFSWQLVDVVSMSARGVMKL